MIKLRKIFFWVNWWLHMLIVDLRLCTCEELDIRIIVLGLFYRWEKLVFRYPFENLVPVFRNELDAYGLKYSPGPIGILLITGFDLRDCENLGTNTVYLVVLRSWGLYYAGPGSLATFANKLLLFSAPIEYELELLFTIVSFES